MAEVVYGASTPCPSRPKTSRLDRSSEGSFASDGLWGRNLNSFDDTREINFTTEIRAPVLTAVKPRRRNRAASSFHIHEDNDSKTEDSVSKGESKNGSAVSTSNRKSSVLAQPAQRFRPKVRFAPSRSPEASRQQAEPEVNSGRSSLEEKKASSRQSNGRSQENQQDIYKKAVRRDTVYIPPDDTTVASVFMGLFSPLKSQGGANYYIPENTQVNSLEAQIARKRLASKSAAASRGKAPLQPSAKIAQETAIQIDVPGKNGGKENIPPGALLVGCGEKKSKTELPVFDIELKSKQMTETLAASKLSRAQSNKIQPSARIGNKALAVKVPSAKRTVLGDKQSRVNASATNVGQKSNGAPRRKLVTCDKPPSTTRNSPIILSKVTIPNLTRRTLNDEYPLLTEDISNPAMYEDNWLAHQEIAITQLVNGLFDYAHGNASSHDPETLRHELLGIYQTGFFTQLYKRIQASLLYGSLNIPKDIIARSSRLKQDVGLKRRFLDLWVQVYDLSSLRAAAETVLGRRISHKSNGVGTSMQTSKGEEKMLKRKLEAFLDTFLLRNEDMDQHAVEMNGAHVDMATWEYARTLLRSIMIIVLLDKGRLCPGTVLPHCLFISSSPYKSSSAVIQALGRLLLPSSGDITKPLNYLDCQVVYKQHRLQEYKYRIDNLAVDLRDGVRLARIVETLVYQSTSCPTTSTLPNGQSDGEDNWPLSQNLKFPCTSRAAKLFNVKIALEALASTKGGGMIVNDTHAEDIVDGHREKTIALLWGLVSKWSLSGLVDWDDLRKEMDRLKRKAVAQFGYEEVKDEDWFKGESHLDEEDEEHTLLLTRWASVLARLKDLHVENLTTSYADGKIYESIVDEYEGYILGRTNDSSCSDNGYNNNKSLRNSLGSRLQALGCSSQFG